MVKVVFFDQDALRVELGCHISDFVARIEERLLGRGYLGCQLVFVTLVPQAQVTLKPGDES